MLSAARLTERLSQIWHDLSVSASPSHLPLVGKGFGLRPVYLMGYVTPSTVMEARSDRSMSWENSQVSFTSPLSQLPA